MDNTSLLYENTDKYEDIERFIGQIEGVYLDFKETKTESGKMMEDDKSIFSKAASGFAHQEGGILIWGIEARNENPNDEDGYDCAIALKPINNVNVFHSELNKYIGESTEPPVDGIKHKIVFENDDVNVNKGFVVSFFPKSDEVHKALGLGKTRDKFYKRYGDRFVPLSTADIKALFFRNLSPDLELHIKYLPNSRIVIHLENRGKGIAKNCAIYLFSQGISRLISNSYSVNPSVVDIRNRVSISHIFFHQDSIHIKLDSGITLCPEEIIEVCSAHYSRDTSEIKYKIFAENMTPKEGSKIYNSGQFLEKSNE